MHVIHITTKWFHKPVVFLIGFHDVFPQESPITSESTKYLPIHLILGMSWWMWMSVGLSIVCLLVFTRISWKEKGFVLANEAWNRASRMNFRSENLRKSWCKQGEVSSLAASTLGWRDLISQFSGQSPFHAQQCCSLDEKLCAVTPVPWICLYGQVVNKEQELVCEWFIWGTKISFPRKV